MPSLLFIYWWMLIRRSRVTRAHLGSCTDNNVYAVCISPRTQHPVLPQKRVRESGKSNKRFHIKCMSPALMTLAERVAQLIEQLSPRRSRGYGQRAIHSLARKSCFRLPYPPFCVLRLIFSARLFSQFTPSDISKLKQIQS